MKLHIQVLAASLLLLPAVSVLAQTAPEAEVRPMASVDGFRSASFGMNEVDVRTSIMKDFKVKNDAIASTENTIEETHVLSLTVPDLLPSGGVSKLNYILGAKSKKLIEVNITWSPAADPAITPPMLARNAELLSSYFRSVGFKADAVQTNLMLNNGSILLFRGADVKGHMAVLVMESEAAADKDKGTTAKRTPKTLLLSYIADPKNPDIFKLPPGSF